jgi:proton-translocating NAD(P)+ transhydrogenase subunit beta
VTRQDAIDVVYLIAAISFILALRGLSGPRTAALGNRLGAFGLVIAVVAACLTPGLTNYPLIIGSIAVGTALGVPAALRVPMTAMPQMVALFNGVGGGAAALVAIRDFADANAGAGSISVAAALAVSFSAVVGTFSFSGSCVTFAKLQELMTGRPIAPRWLRPVFVVLMAAVGVLAGLTVAGSSLALGLLAAVSLAFGALFVLPVGGADVPVVISLLNAFTGLAVAAAGAVTSNMLLIIAGTLVGASGTLLTRMMSRAMGRSLPAILFGAFRGSTAGNTAESTAGRPVRSAAPEDVAVMLAYASRVVIVPGYGLAVAQGQHASYELVRLLESRGVEVVFAIHPVAGRMPGHMNVLLAEADVPYEKLREMDEVNPQFARTDVVLVVGANDVVNPAARDDPDSPIYGMPILHVDEAANVIFLKRSMRPGFAGIENELLYHPRTTMLFGDAKESLTKLVAAVKALD